MDERGKGTMGCGSGMSWGLRVARGRLRVPVVRHKFNGVHVHLDRRLINKCRQQPTYVHLIVTILNVTLYPIIYVKLVLAAGVFIANDNEMVAYNQTTKCRKLQNF